MNNHRAWIFIFGGVVLVCLCVIVAAALVGGLAFFPWGRNTDPTTSRIDATRVITVEQGSNNTQPQENPVETPLPDTQEPGTSLTPVVPDSTSTPLKSPQETIDTILNEQVPINDPVDLAERLEGKLDIPGILEEQRSEYSLGDKKPFYLTNSSTNETFQVQTSLGYKTDHLYFWIEDGVEYDKQALKRLCETFENDIYPTNRDYFGSEWSPGVDNDLHLYVVYASGLGGNLAGAYSASDEYHPDAREFSNAHEMFVMNADNVNLNGEFVFSTMAHEFQHMIHWYQDRNEETWVSEGFSTLSQQINNYEIGGSDFTYTSDPDLQLNNWPNNGDTFPHYGSSFLFASYFLDRFGKDAVKALIAHPENGLRGFDRVLESLNASDPRTGGPVRADDLFSDWVVTSFLNDPDVEDGRYAYRGYPQAPSPGNTEDTSFCSSEWQERDVKQYGADYIRIGCEGNFTLKFEGAAEVGVVPENPYSGQYAFWSNKGDESNMTLTRSFDFTQVSGPITLTYHTWFDLEADYDYLYVLISENGKDWQILHTPSGTDEDPSGNSYGWGYNGTSDEWIEESIDLSAFSGKKIDLRFEYVTDMAVNGEGFLLDDVQIPEIQYSEDFENGDGGWDGKGFVRIQNRLPQTFRISIIRRGNHILVETVKLESGQSASIPLKFGSEIEDAVLVVSGTTRHTIQPALYRFRFEK